MRSLRVTSAGVCIIRYVRARRADGGVQFNPGTGTVDSAEAEDYIQGACQARGGLR